MKDKKPIASGMIDQDLLLGGFFDNHPSALEEGGLPLPLTAETRDFINTVWPMSDAYTSSLSSVFLVQVLDLKMLAQRTLWLVRDGLVPLLWFFRRFPNPGNLQTKLLIYEDLIPFVPAAWMNHVGSYRIFSNAKKTAHGRVMLLGIVSEAYCTVENVRQQIAAIKERELNSDQDSISGDTFLPVRSAWKDDEVAFHPEYFRVLYSELGFSWRSLLKNEVCSTFDMHNLRVYDLNDHMLLSDNSMVHDLLSRGAQWPLSEPLANDEEFVRLSPNHGFAVKKTVTTISDHSELEKSYRLNVRYQQRLEAALSSRAFKDLPWPKWFADWVRSASTELAVANEKMPVATPSALMAKPRKVMQSTKARANRN